MNLLLFDATELSDDGVVTLSDGLARHVRDVLRAIPEQALRVGITDGPFGVGRVLEVGDGGVRLQCTFETDVPARPAVDLVLAVPRPKALRRLWAQLAALGVGRIILTNAERVERNYFDTHVMNPSMYRPRLVEGLQQARDTRLPLVSIHRRFRVLVEDELDGLTDARTRVVADPNVRESVADVCGRASRTRVVLAIGPEGGWNAFELDLLRQHGFHPIGMGPRTLRSDTACIALLALVHDALR